MDRRSQGWALRGGVPEKMAGYHISLRKPDGTSRPATKEELEAFDAERRGIAREAECNHPEGGS